MTVPPQRGDSTGDNDGPVLVTGGDTRTGRAVVAMLRGEGIPTRALVQDRDGAERLHASQGGHAPLEIIVGDLTRAQDLQAAVQEVSAIYYICPAMHPAERLIGEALIGVCQAAEVPRFVYHSILHAQAEAAPYHWRKLRVEEALVASGLAYTILRPALYFQHLSGSWQDMVTTGRLPVPVHPEARLAMVDLRDVADVVVSVLTQPGHVGAAYDLCGPRDLTYDEVAATAAAVLDRPVRAERADPYEWARQVAQTTRDERAADLLLRTVAYYESCGLPGNSNVTQWLLRRDPTPIEAFLERLARRTGDVGPGDSPRTPQAGLAVQ